MSPAAIGRITARPGLHGFAVSISDSHLYPTTAIVAGKQVAGHYHFW
jgi:hypothetical protein